MKTALKLLAVACSGGLLFACADVGTYNDTAGVATRVAGSASDAYLVGRQQHLAGRYAEAIASYEAALRAEPGHVNASNGLATVYAEQGELTRAIALWQQLLARLGDESGPGTAFLYSNLGYAYLLHGEYDNAVGALERACVLDPINHRAWRHLGAALDKLGEHERAQQMMRQAATLEGHDIKADYALAQRSGVPAIASAIDDGLATTEIKQAPNGIFELRRIPAAGAPPQAAVPATAPAAVGNTLEISNGNGVTGMAKSLALQMEDPSLRVVRLSNQKGFAVKQTRVEYQPMYRAAAARLAERVGSAATVEASNYKGADMRLVIGRDLVEGKGAAKTLAAKNAKPRRTRPG